MPVFDQRDQKVDNQTNIAGDANINQSSGPMNTGDTYSGNFQGAILNIRSTLTNVTQTIGTIPYATDQDKQTLTDLITQLTTALEQTTQQQPDTKDDTEAVAATAQTLVDQANQAKPNRSLLKITGDGLLKAAENIAKVTPPVLAISQQIVSFILKMVAT
jgi:hypothetical protein